MDPAPPCAGTSGNIVDMKELGVWEPYQVHCACSACWPEVIMTVPFAIYCTSVHGAEFYYAHALCGSGSEGPAATSASLACLQVKAQTVKTAVEAATLLLRIDDIVRWG